MCNNRDSPTENEAAAAASLSTTCLYAKIIDILSLVPRLVFPPPTNRPGNEAKTYWAIKVEHSRLRCLAYAW